MHATAAFNQLKFKSSFQNLLQHLGALAVVAGKISVTQLLCHILMAKTTARSRSLDMLWLFQLPRQRH